MRRQIPLLIVAIIGITMVVAVFIPHAPFPDLNDKFSITFDIIAAFAFLLGGGNLVRIHGDRLYRRGKNWPYSLVTLVGFFGMLIVGLFKIGNPAHWQGPVDDPASAFGWMYLSVFSPLQSTMFSLLAFFVATASYRAFRAKTREATILLVAAFIILLGRTPLGPYLTGWLPGPLQFLHIPNLASWILSWPNLAGQRAIQIGIALGIISTSLKIILGIERSYLGGKDEG